MLSLKKIRKNLIITYLIISIVDFISFILIYWKRNELAVYGNTILIFLIIINMAMIILTIALFLWNKSIFLNNTSSTVLQLALGLATACAGLPIGFLLNI